MQPTPLEQAVFRTLAWFSLFEYPVTVFEIWKWLFSPDRTYDLVEVCRVVEESSWLCDRIQTKQGFVSLAGASMTDLVCVRQERFLDSVRKFKALRRAAYWFQFLPGVRAVGAANTMAWWHTTADSDIDLYIVTKPKFIWSTRLFLVTPFRLLGKRPHTSDEVQDPFCFSFFNSSDNLLLEDLQIEHDYYLAFWTKSIVPVVDKDDVFARHFQENRWAHTQLPHARLRAVHHQHQPRPVRALPFQSRWFEWVARPVQKRLFPDEIRELANKDTRVVVTDQMLKLYPTDRREQYRNAFDEILEKQYES
jgi:hypothetical protein